MFPTISWNLITLEMLMAAVLVVLVVLDLLLPKDTRRDWLGNVSIASVFGLLIFWLTQHDLTGATFNNTFVMDSFAWFFKGFFLLAMFFVLVMTQQYFKSIALRINAFYFLLWLAAIGMCLIASSTDFLVLFISMEIMTLSFYVMTAYLKTDKLSIEAGMKYLILGALSSGLFLYGISLLYGTAHSTHFDTIQAYANTHGMSPMVLFSLVLIFATVAFKIAAVPFHMWVPDVYQGAPTPVTAFLSVGSKAAGFVILIRLFLGVFEAWHIQWSMVLAVLSAITMCYGNLVAVFQTNIKRLFGYSSIAHAGYLLMGAAAGTALGISAMNFYLLGYLFTNLAAFTVIVLFYVVTKSDAIEDYAGLAKRSSILGVTLLIALISLAGMPPLAGFFGKFSLLMATMQAGYNWLALIAVFNIIVSLYYYLKVAKKVFVDHPKSSTKITVSQPLRLTLIFAAAAIIAIGLFQGPFMEIAMDAVSGMVFHP